MNDDWLPFFYLLHNNDNDGMSLAIECRLNVAAFLINFIFHSWLRDLN